MSNSLPRAFGCHARPRPSDRNAGLCPLRYCWSVSECENPRPMIGPRGPMPLRRMTAHWVVLAAAALTTLVAAAVAAALAVFAGQALPRAVTHDLSAAPGTALAATGPVGGAAQLTQVTGALQGGHRRRAARHSVRLLAGLLVRPARPGARSAAGQARRGERAGHAAARGRRAQRHAGHAVLVSGRWPAAPAGTVSARADPGGAPRLRRRAAARVRWRRAHAARTGRPTRPCAFTVTGLFARAPAGGHRRLLLAGQLAARQRVERRERVRHLRAAARRPRGVPRRAHRRRRAPGSAQPDMAAFTGGDLNSFAAIRVRARRTRSATPRCWTACSSAPACPAC